MKTEKSKVTGRVVEDIWMNTQVGNYDDFDTTPHTGGESRVGHTDRNTPADSREIEQSTSLINPDLSGMDRG
jgi:hypothetical protein